jgi:hypothetical protein
MVYLTLSNVLRACGLLKSFLMAQSLVVAMVFVLVLQTTARAESGLSAALDDADSSTSVDALLPSSGSRALEDDYQDTYDAGVQTWVTPPAKLDLCSQAKQTGADCFGLTVKLLDFVASGYSFPGDRVEALVIKDTRSKDGVSIPAGSKLVGVVEESFLETQGKAPKAKLTLLFTELWTPHSQEPEPIRAEWRREANVLTVVGKGIGKSAVSGAKGALKGALSGIGMALMTSGSSLITSSGLGALTGIHKGIMDTHSAIVLSEGEEIRLRLASSDPKQTLLLSASPSMLVGPSPDTALVSLSDITAQLGVDPFATQNQLNVGFKLQNDLSDDIKAMNVAVVDDYGQRYFLSPFGGNHAYKTTFRAKQQTQAQLTFTVKAGQPQYYLVVYNPAKPTEVLLKTALPKTKNS